MSIANKLKQFAGSSAVKSVGIYSLSGLMPRAISFLLIPVFTNLAYMTTEDNGILSLLNRATLFLLPFVSLGIIQSASTDFFKLEKKQFSEFLVSGIVLSAGFLLLALLVFGIGKNYFVSKYNLPFSFVWAVPLAAFFTFLIEVLLAIVRNQNKPWLFLSINTGRIILELGIALVLIISFQFHWKGRLAGILAAALTLGIFAIWYFYKQGYFTERPKKNYIKQELLYAMPIVLLQFSVFCMSASDSFFLSEKNQGNTGLVGIYGIACTFATIVNMVASSYLMYLMPKIYSLLSEKEIPYLQIRKEFIYYLLVNIAALLLVLIITPLFYKFFIPPVYHEALPYFYLLAAGYCLWGITYFFYSFLLYNKSKKILTILSVLNIIISLVIYRLFIHKWNMWGAALGVFTSYFLILVVTLAFSKSYIKKIFST